jgi:hypothetical protein
LIGVYARDLIEVIIDLIVGEKNESSVQMLEPQLSLMKESIHILSEEQQ